MSRRSVGRWVVAGLALGLLGLGGCQDRSRGQQEGTGGAGMEGQQPTSEPAMGGSGQDSQIQEPQPSSTGSESQEQQPPESMGGSGTESQGQSGNIGGSGQEMQEAGSRDGGSSVTY